MNSLAKTVKLYSTKLDPTDFQNLNDLTIHYGMCRSMLFNRFCGIDNMLLIKDWRQIRNKFRKTGYSQYLASHYNFLGKHWVCSLADTSSNVNSQWSNLANRIRKAVQNNDYVDKDEQHFIYFILSIREYWYGVLHYNLKIVASLKPDLKQHFKNLRAKLSAKQVKHAYSYLRRLTRRYKYRPKKHRHCNKSMNYDENMYKIKDSTITISSAKSRKRFKLDLTSSWHYSYHGNLQIVLDRVKKRVEIHKLIITHGKPLITKKKELGIDKGLATLLSCSSGNEYGIGFSNLTRPKVDYFSNYQARRNPYFGKRYQIQQQIINTKTDKAKYYWQKQLAKLADNNLGSKRYQMRSRHYHACLENRINYAVKQMLRQEKPSLIVKEDLTFTKDKLPKCKNKFEKRLRRQLNSWAKGLLNERIEYLCNYFGIDFRDVNPAYTSQYCPYCGQHFGPRTGKHHEIVYCKNCGKLNCNLAAAINILNRLHDPKIKLYTPYKKVKEILDARI